MSRERHERGTTLFVIARSILRTTQWSYPSRLPSHGQRITIARTPHTAVGVPGAVRARSARTGGARGSLGGALLGDA